MARSHYENFSIGSFFLPKSIRSDLTNIYAFCRLADDFADEAVEGVSRLEMLDNWELMLENAAIGDADNALFAALGATIRNRSLPLQPFHDLLTAFRRDLSVTRYETMDQLFDYCRYSANPVGRLVLAVCGLKDEQFFAYSDNICTALQLANHWQDVKEDFFRGRIYIPQKILQGFHITEKDLASDRPSDDFRRMMTHLCNEADALFEAGKPLIRLVGRPLSPQLYLYHGGGRAALASIRKANGDVLSRKRRVGFSDRVRLLAGSLMVWSGANHG